MMYFGTRDRAVWVEAPAPGAGFAATGFEERIQYINGGVGLRQSTNAHLEYDFTWNSLTRDQIAAIEDYSYGLYGNGLVHFLDPVAMDRNLFNAAWAAPKITAEDGIPLVGSVRPSRVLIGDMSLNYPMYAAQYTVTTSMVSREFYCPIPLGYTAWVGIHGLTNAKGLRVQPMLNNSATGSVTSLPITAVTNNTIFGGSVNGTSTVNGIVITVDTTADTTMTIAGMMLRVLKTDITPTAGGFTSGRGNSGCVFDGKLQVMPYSLPGESIGMKGRLVEVGDWL